LEREFPKFEITRKCFQEILPTGSLHCDLVVRFYLQTLFHHTDIPKNLEGVFPELPLNHFKTSLLDLQIGNIAESPKVTSGTEIQVKVVEKPTLIKPSKEKDVPLVHVFEKVLTADDFQGGAKAADGSDESEEHANALNELNFNSIIRTSREAETYLKSDTVVEGPNVKAEEPSAVCHFKYPEWFHDEKGYRNEWCLLRETEFSRVKEFKPVEDSSETLRQVKWMQTKLSRLYNQNIMRNREKDGQELDIDSIVRWYSQKCGSGYLDQRIFCRKKRIARDVAFMILVDRSISTDSWVLNCHVIDELLKMLRILRLSLNDFTEKVAVASFSSESRVNCSFGWLKRFEEPWKDLDLRISNLQPQGYTRLGVAIRHATTQLLKIQAQRRALVVLSDAKPTDFDYYEGKHGNEDTRKAVQEALASDIRFRAVVLSDRNKASFNQIFGVNCYHCVKPGSQVSGVLVDEFIQSLR
jgi:nitric oxide reductase NorD protein